MNILQFIHHRFFGGSGAKAGEDCGQVNMQLFIKTELEMNALAKSVHKGFCSGQTLTADFAEVLNKMFIGYLIPPNIGQLVLYQNSGAWSVKEMLVWPYYFQVEGLPVLTKQQEEMVWTQLKMSGCFLGTNKSVLEVKAVKSGSAPSPT